MQKDKQLRKLKCTNPLLAGLDLCMSGERHSNGVRAATASKAWFKA